MRRIVLPLVTLILAGLFATLGTVGLRRADEAPTGAPTGSTGCR